MREKGNRQFRPHEGREHVIFSSRNSVRDKNRRFPKKGEGSQERREAANYWKSCTCKSCTCKSCTCTCTSISTILFAGRGTAIVCPMALPGLLIATS